MVSRKLLGIVVLVSLLLFVTGCQELVVSENNDSENEAVSEETVSKTSESRAKDVSGEEFEVVVSGTEGDLISLSPKAIDPDGDYVKYIFSEPFSEKGRWQTRIGDEGDYMVTVKAHDGELYTTQDILVRVLRANRVPMLNCPDKITVKEGETIKLNCNPIDPEGQEVVVTYAGFMASATKAVGFNDAGSHSVVVTAWDKVNSENKVKDTVAIIVQDVNRPPTVLFGFGDTITVTEGDLINARPEVEDPDGDKVTLKFSKPFDNKGLWQTGLGDAGEYNANAVVSDGTNIITKKFKVIVLSRNTAPKFDEEFKDQIFVNEGDKITLDVKATDREGDEIFVTIKGFMQKASKITTYDDAHPAGCPNKGCTAVYPVTVTISDGTLESSMVVKVNVKDKNRPPVFRVPA